MGRFHWLRPKAVYSYGALHPAGTIHDGGIHYGDGVMHASEALFSISIDLLDGELEALRSGWYHTLALVNNWVQWSNEVAMCHTKPLLYS